MRISKNLFVYCMPCLCFGLIILSNALGFLSIELEPWDQIIYYNKLDSSSLTVGLVSHFTRYAVVSPTFLISELMGISVQVIYTLYVLIVVYLTALCWTSLILCRSRRRDIACIFGCIPYLLLFVSNGRFVFALCGFGVLHCAIYQIFLLQRYFIRAFLIFIGLFLTSVSSGTFLVSVSILLSSQFTSASTAKFSSLRYIYRRISRYFISPIANLFVSSKANLSTIARYFFEVLMFLFFGILLGLFIHKNVEYFSQSNTNLFSIIYEMLSHGFGFIFNIQRTLEECNLAAKSGALLDPCSIAQVLQETGYFVIPLLLIASIFLVWLFYKLASTRRFDVVLKMTLLSSCFFGLFGITTLMSLLSAFPLFTWSGGKSRI